MINRRKDMLITGGLIMKKKKIRLCLAKGTMVPAWLEEKSKEMSTALEESGIEAGRD
jgi:hypothetical protein